MRDAAQAARERLVAEYDVLYTYSARTFEAFCRLADEKKLAERVRRSARRARRGVLEPEGEGKEEPAGGVVEGEEVEPPPATVVTSP